MRGWPPYAEDEESFQEEIASLRAAKEAAEAERDNALAEVEHWVTHCNELESWRVQTAQLKMKAEAALAECQSDRKALAAKVTVHACTVAEALAPTSRFEYDQGDVVLTHYDDLYLLNERAEKAEAKLATLEQCVLDLQVHAREHGWQDSDDPISALLQWQPSAALASHERQTCGTCEELRKAATRASAELRHAWRTRGTPATASPERFDAGLISRAIEILEKATTPLPPAPSGDAQ